MKQLWELDRDRDNEWKLFDASAKLAGYASGEACANQNGWWRVGYLIAENWVDAIRKAKEKRP